MGKLTKKQEQFCLEYLIDKNATKSAIRAGYSEKTAGTIGGENMQKPEILSRINQLLLERAERTKIDADWVLQSAKRIYDRCMQDEPVLDRRGDPVMCKTENGEYAAAYKFDSSGANKALETIAKHNTILAFEKDKEEDREAVPLNITFNTREPVGDVKITKGKAD